MCLRTTTPRWASGVQAGRVGVGGGGLPRSMHAARRASQRSCGKGVGGLAWRCAGGNGPVASFVCAACGAGALQRPAGCAGRAAVVHWRAVHVSPPGHLLLRAGARSHIQRTFTAPPPCMPELSQPSSCCHVVLQHGRRCLCRAVLSDMAAQADGSSLRGADLSRAVAVAQCLATIMAASGAASGDWAMFAWLGTPGRLACCPLLADRTVPC